MIGAGSHSDQMRDHQANKANHAADGNGSANQERAEQQ